MEDNKDNPQSNLSFINNMLLQGVKHSKHPFHQCVVGTLFNDLVNIRTVVLRKWVLKRRTIMFHTDIRSPKVNEIRQSSNCSLLFYSKPDKLQLRFKCKAHVHHKNRLTKYLFSQATNSQKQCYRYPLSPSTIISDKTKEISVNESELVDAYQNFGVCVCNFYEIDSLFLSQKGHVRLLYEWDKYNNLTTNYLVA